MGAATATGATPEAGAVVAVAVATGAATAREIMSF